MCDPRFYLFALHFKQTKEKRNGLEKLRNDTLPRCNQVVEKANASFFNLCLLAPVRRPLRLALSVGMLVIQRVLQRCSGLIS